MSKYNTIYSIEWTPRHIGQTYVWAEIIDLDGNLVRTEVRTFNIGTNVEQPASQEIMSVRQMAKENMLLESTFRISFAQLMTMANIHWKGLQTSIILIWKETFL